MHNQASRKCRARHKAWQLEDLGLWDNFPTACVADVVALLVLSIYNTMDKCSSNITKAQLSSICYCPFKMSSVTAPGFTRTTNSVRLQDETKISKFRLLLCTSKDSLKKEIRKTIPSEIKMLRNTFKQRWQAFILVTIKQGWKLKETQMIEVGYSNHETKGFILLAY